MILPHFTYCMLVWGSKIVEGHALHLLQKRSLRIVVNTDYVAHSEPICKSLNILKVTDMFKIMIWKFYYKLMNGILPSYFDIMKPVLPPICDYHDVRRPIFHLPHIMHEFAEQLIQYQLIRQLNAEQCSILITTKVHTHSFVSFKC